MVSNTLVSDNSILREGLRVLSQRLPTEWSVDFTTGLRPDIVDAYIQVVAPDKEAGLLAVEIRRRLEPRGAIELVAKLKDMPSDGIPLIVSPYLSPTVRDRLRDSAVAFLDITGNIRLELQKPGLFIETQGADTNPNRNERPSRSLRGSKAGRVVRVLVDSKRLLGVREIAQLADVNPGYVSRILALLDSSALIQRGGRGQIEKVDWQRLLKRWAEDSPLGTRGIQATCLEPRGFMALRSKLSKIDMRYAITGTFSAMRFAPIAAPRLAMLYVEDLQRAISELGLHAVESGANILLIEPKDLGVFAGVVVEDGLSYVAASQAAADLLTSPGRGPAEAEELMSWMGTHEDDWRG